jgi:vacuolar-type H+-ATPase subunit D/Vma8
VQNIIQIGVLEMKWENRPSVSESHPFKEEYDRLLDLDRDELLMEIRSHIDNYFEMKSKREQLGKLNVKDLLTEQWHKNSIETFYWKFINIDTKVKD